ncbi:MAG TPA: hypothetical protein VGF97_09035 [Rhizomicrobium sp.]
MAALDALVAQDIKAQWHFLPGTEKGVPRSGWINVEAMFRA